MAHIRYQARRSRNAAEQTPVRRAGQAGATLRCGGPSATFSPVSLVQTVLVFVAIPAAIYGVLALLTLRVRTAKTPRYRPGQDWDHPPVWWTASPDGAAQPVQVVGEDSARGARTAWGGARGSW
jgi:hypothetical protein